MTAMLTWLGIVVCATQSACFSGLNLAMFTISRLRLETAAESGDADAARVLALRRDANYTLATILWANVAVNVLLTLLAESVMAGVWAFLFSTVVITAFGEIAPQAYFARHALWVAARLAPLLRIYRVLLWPIARPVGKLLDYWVGPEGIPWYREKELRDVLWRHARSPETEVSPVEAKGAINFLVLDDLPVGAEGKPLDPRSVVTLPMKDHWPEFPPVERSQDDPFLRRLVESGKKWVVIADEDENPHFVVNTNAFVREALFGDDAFDPLALCRRPLIVDDVRRPLGQVLGRFTVWPEKTGDDVIHEDLILVWTAAEKRIITGADILGRLFRGIASVAPPNHKPKNSPRQGES